MNKNRIINFLLGLALVVTAAFTARQALATAETTSAGARPAASVSDESLCPFTDEERASIRSVYIPESRGSWLRSDTGFIGYEGGMLALLNCR